MKRSFYFQILLLLCLSAPFQAQVVTYPAPQEEILSKDYSMEVNGKPVDIYLAQVTDVKDPPAWALQKGDLGGPYSFAYFDFTGSVTIKITSLKKPLEDLVIRPVSSGINPLVNDNVITLTISEPCKLSIEPEGRIEPLLLFANPLETYIPERDDPNVIYYGPGIHKPVKIKVSSGQTLYIAGGAIVKGGVEVTGHDVKIRGRGILCGNDWAWRNGPGNMIRMENAVNVSVEDIILRGSWSWTIPMFGCDSVSITNVKLCCSKNPNDDGINPCNSQHVVIRDCFIRSDDDCIAMKGINFKSDNDNIEYITVEDCLLWCDRARIFLLGHESRAQYMRQIVLRNLDILHLSMTPFLFEPGEEMSIEDVLVENVRIHAEYWYPGARVNRDFITLRPTINKYMHNQVPGRIKNITFKNVSLSGRKQEEGYRIWVKGADEDHRVTGVSFENINMFGKTLSIESPGVIIEDNTENIRFGNNNTSFIDIH